MNQHETSDAGGKELVRPGKHDENEASFINRIGASASGLIQNSWTHPGPRAVTDHLAAADASLSKGESSTSSTRGPTTFASEALDVAQSQASTCQGLDIGESFRSQRGNERHHYQDEFDQWSSPRADEVQENALSGSDSAHTPSCRPAIQKRKAHANALAEHIGGAQYEEMESNDGSAVVSLLNSPTFDVDDLPSNVWDCDPPVQTSQVTQADQVLLSNGISPTSLSKSQLESFRMQPSSVQYRSVEVYTQSRMKQQSRTLDDQAIPGGGRQQGGSLRLIPDFDVPEEVCVVNNPEASQRDNLRARLSNASGGDVTPWLDILDRYHDDVWGTMLPLTRMARDEVRSGNDIKRPEFRGAKDGPAVRRLRLLLQHVGHSS